MSRVVPFGQGVSVWAVAKRPSSLTTKMPGASVAQTSHDEGLDALAELPLPLITRVDQNSLQAFCKRFSGPKRA